MSNTPGEPPTHGWTPPTSPAAPPTWGQQQPGWAQQPGTGWGAAPRPGIIPLRPLAVGEILDGAFTTMRLYPRATLGLSAIVASIGAIAQFVLALAVRNAAGSGSFTALALGVALLGLLINGLASLVLTGMLTVVISEAVLGRPIALGHVWARVRPRITSLVGASILVGLTVLLGTIAFIVPGVYLAVALAFTTPALILEGQKVTGAMGRSRALVKGDWWRVLGILILAALIANFVSTVIALPFVFLSGATSSFGFGAEPVQLGITALLLQAVGQILARTMTAPITAGVTVLLYIDRRMRREGLDVSLASATEPPPPGPVW